MIDRNVENKLVGSKLVGHDITIKHDAKYITLDFETESGSPMRLTFVLDKEASVTTYVRRVTPPPSKVRGPSHNTVK
jgi:hypothetical protein